jgi:hypothetical protein
MIPKPLTAIILFLLLFKLHSGLGLKKKWLLLSQLLLLSSPWFIQLLLSPVELNWLFSPATSIGQFFDNLAVYSSDEYVFFSGDDRLQYGTQEAGLLYLSWLPLWLIGLIQSIGQPAGKISLWLGIGVLVASLFGPAPNLSVSLLYIPAAQILTSLGLVHILKVFKKQPPLLKLVILLLLAFMIYEIIGFFHILTVHYPKRLQDAGIRL